MITTQLILALNPRHPRPDVAAAKLQVAADKYGITTQRQVAAFVSQLAHESALIPQEENLSYRATRIAQVWPNRFPTVQSALPYQFNPPALASKVYGGRMGNTLATDGWDFHGRGFIQLTGRTNYATYGKLTGFDLTTSPDMLLQYGVSALVAGGFWQSHGLNAAADRGDVVSITQAINGGLNGLSDRESLYQRALNRVPRYGLLDTDAPLDVEGDLSADLDMRHEAFTQALALC